MNYSFLVSGKKSPPGEPLWLSGKVVKNEKINEIERTRVRSPPRATSLIKVHHVRSVELGRQFQG
jgi:hypothetical protein